MAYCVSDSRSNQLSYDSIFVPAEGLEPPNPKGRGFTVPSNCRYAIQAFCLSCWTRTNDIFHVKEALYQLS